jgi:hypothetical protein
MAIERQLRPLWFNEEIGLHTMPPEFGGIQWFPPISGGVTSLRTLFLQVSAFYFWASQPAMNQSGQIWMNPAKLAA